MVSTSKARPADCPHAAELDKKLKIQTIKEAVDAACKAAKAASEEEKKNQELIEAEAKREAENAGEEYDGTYCPKLLRVQWKTNGVQKSVNCNVVAYDEDGSQARIDEVEAARRKTGLQVLVDKLATGEESILTKDEMEVLAEKQGYRVINYEFHPFRRYSSLAEAQKVARGEAELTIGVAITKEEVSSVEGQTSYVNKVAKLLGEEVKTAGYKIGSARGGKMEDGKKYTLKSALTDYSVGYCWHANGQFICRDNRLSNILDVTEESGKQLSDRYDESAVKWMRYQNSSDYIRENSASAAASTALQAFGEFRFQDDEDEYAVMTGSTS